MTPLLHPLSHLIPGGRPEPPDFESTLPGEHPLPAAHAQQAIEAGSSSFAAAARLFDAATRESTVLLYAWCRHCDDVIDGQTLGHGQVDAHHEHHAEGDGPIERLAALEAATLAACVPGAAPTHPVFAGLAEVVGRHQLPTELLLEHLDGFRMDVEARRYESFADTLLYCYRVAGIVGLLMARVMGARDPAALDHACDLGIAFQLTNISRDIVEDAQIGRVYLPADWLAAAGIGPGEAIVAPAHRAALAAVAARLVEAAEPYYRSSLSGLGSLPWRSAWSVATARDVYRAIGRKVRQQGPRAWDARVATSTLDKLWFIARGAAVALAARRLEFAERDRQLWQRPH